MIIREATAADWIELELFFKRIYRERHPLHNKDFWEWQYGNQEFGRSFICLNYGGKVVGHVGANFGGGLAWIINVYLDEECRGKGILTKLYQLARSYYPLAATAANEAGLGLYKNMRWIRYYDLVRYVKINPNALDKDFSDICKHVNVHIDSLILKDTHYFRQPSLKGILMDDGTRAISQESVGGLRVVEIVNLQKMEEQAWQLGYLWMDYVSSWNDLETKNLEKNGWVPDYKSIVPWRLNPIQENYFCDITFLSEEPLNKEFVVHRSFSDHGRIGSIK